jgi:hypothetical protein
VVTRHAAEEAIKKRFNNNFFDYRVEIEEHSKRKKKCIYWEREKKIADYYTRIFNYPIK